MGKLLFQLSVHFFKFDSFGLIGWKDAVFIKLFSNQSQIQIFTVLPTRLPIAQDFIKFLPLLIKSRFLLRDENIFEYKLQSFRTPKQ